jgi:histidinol phosphatase-like enzyme
VFPGLKGVTSPKPDAARFVEWAHKKGHRLVVATNPLFPHTAIDQRLAWAGFPIDQYHFDLITSYESFHFAKPNPFYIAEILAQLGWPDEPTVMIGNDAKDDIFPAAQLGLATFWVNSQPAGNQPLPAGVNRYGSLDDLVKWLDSIEGLAIQKETLTTPESCLAILNANLAALLTLTNLCSDTHQKQLSNLIGQWRDAETRRNLPWIQQVLQEENPTLSDHTLVLAAEILEAKQSLAEFTTARLSTIAHLSRLTPQDWSRSLRHPTLGASNLTALISLIAGEDQVWMRRCWQVVRQHS